MKKKEKDARALESFIWCLDLFGLLHYIQSLPKLGLMALRLISDTQVGLCGRV